MQSCHAYANLSFLRHSFSLSRAAFPYTLLSKYANQSLRSSSIFPPMTLRQQQPQVSTCTDYRMRACEQEEKDPEWITVDLPSDTADSSTETHVSEQSAHVRATRTYSIPSSRYSDKSSQKEVRIHVLPLSTAAGGTIIAQITRKLVEEKIPPEQITQEHLDARIRGAAIFFIYGEQH